MTVDRQLYSVIDACLNRAAEGLRVCEDLLRFHRRNTELSSKLKELRHRIFHAAAGFPYRELLNGRDVRGDGQKFLSAPSQGGRATADDAIRANLHRAMEAVRTLEETAKIIPAAGPGVRNAAESFQEIRFSLYEIEKEAVAAAAGDNNRSFFMNSLYAILDSAFVKGPCEDAALKLIRGGARIIQLRMKGEPSGSLYRTARAVSAVCRDHQTLFIVNDHPDIACLTDAGGVHLGQDDLPVEEVRRLLPETMVVGLSTHSPEQARAAILSMPDYIAVGPLFGTASKMGEPLAAIGLDTVRTVRSESGIPIVGIGGITAENAGECIGAGCSSLAVISYLFREGRIEENCGAMLRAINDAAAV